MPSPKEPPPFKHVGDIELTIDGERYPGVQGIRSSEPTADVPIAPRQIGRLPSSTIECTCPPIWGTWLEIMCRGFGVELQWEQHGRNGGYIGESDVELCRRARQLLMGPDRAAEVCNKLGCRSAVGPGGHRLPEGALCKQCSEQLRRMTRRPEGAYVGVCMGWGRPTVIFASWDGRQMAIRGEPIE